MVGSELTLTLRILLLSIVKKSFTKFSLSFLCGQKPHIVLGKKRIKQRALWTILLTAATSPQFKHWVQIHSTRSKQYNKMWYYKDSTVKLGKIQRNMTRIRRSWDRFWASTWENSAMKNGTREVGIKQVSNKVPALLHSSRHTYNWPVKTTLVSSPH